MDSLVLNRREHPDRGVATAAVVEDLEILKHCGRRRGPNKAAIAVPHSILNVIWHFLTTGPLYDDPGADNFTWRHDPAVEARRPQKRTEALGFEVTIATAGA